MSTAQIYDVIRGHTGPYASDGRKVSTAEVTAMIAAARPLGAAQRLALLDAVQLFGGNIAHPDIFEHPADKPRLVDAALDGIADAEGFGALSAHEQALFIEGAYTLAEASVACPHAGFRYGAAAEVPAEVAGQIRAATAATYLRMDHQRFAPAAPPRVQVLTRNGEVYGYCVDLDYPERATRTGFYRMQATFAAHGGFLHVRYQGYQPPTP